VVGLMARPGDMGSDDHVIQREQGPSRYGSCANTSRAAPAIHRSRRARTRAASSTIGPRAVLIRYDDDFIAPQLWFTDQAPRCRRSGT